MKNIAAIMWCHKINGESIRICLAKHHIHFAIDIPHMAEKIFGWDRKTVAPGLNELRSGVVCIDNFKARGNKKPAEKMPQLENDMLRTKITPQLAQEIGSRLSIRFEGACIKHPMGSASVKIYDKYGRVLRIETTTNDVSFFKHHRKVEHKNGAETRELAPLKKSIWYLFDLREILFGCNRRYLDFLSSPNDNYTRATSR